MSDYDAIVVGAGHNGLTAATILAQQGLRVCVLEKQPYVGGMAATRELWKGYRHNLGAWALMVLCPEIEQALALDEHGLEVIDPVTSFTNFGIPGEKPFALYNDFGRLSEHLGADHGEEALFGFMRMLESCRVFEEAYLATRFEAPPSVGALLDGAPDDHSRDILRKWFFLSAEEMVDEFFPDPNRNGLLKCGLLGTAVDGTGLGPSAPGTAFSLAYHLTSPGLGNGYKLVRGGMGNFTGALATACEKHGGEIRLKTAVRSVLVEDRRVAGVELRSGERVTAPVVLSNVDAQATFLGLCGGEHLPDELLGRVRAIKHEVDYIQVHVVLKELPEFTGELAFANEGGERWLMAYYNSVDHLDRSWEDCKRGRLPADPMSAYMIPSMWDDSLAPAGFHVGTFFGFFLPHADRGSRHTELKNAMADRMIARMTEYAPNLSDAIVDRRVFTPLHFEKMYGITRGDYTHALLLPSQMLDYRPVVGCAGYQTPLDGLYLCGAACHPGPGVSGIPGYNSARTVLRQRFDTTV